MATLKEIARMTGFSVSVVSRALNRNPDRNARVAEKTRRTIKEATRRMKYQPNRAAEFLRRGRRSTIGAFLPRNPNRLLSEIIFGLSEAASEEGFPLSFSFGMNAECYERFFATQSDISHCGIITYPYADDTQFTHNSRIAAVVDSFQKAGGKVVLMYSPQGVPGVPMVTVDEHETGRIAAARLLERACRRFALLETYWGRTEGFLDTLRAAGKDVLRLPCNADGLAQLVEAAKIRTKTARPLGVFAARGDRDAMKVYGALQPNRIQLGRDVLLIGCNDHRLSEEVVPPLTTIHLPFEDMGRIAMRKVINLIYEKEEATVKLKARLVVRGTA